ncbi:MAG: ATP phosphoribosyltransferase [Crenarchaeota archaeon]|nr:ATP phosphoribosyltransferase [Thermoproteota archaeon]
MRLLSQVGLKTSSTDDRALIVQTSWPSLSLVRLRPEDIPSIVETGAAIMGITGLDFVLESESDVEVLLGLGFGRGRIVLAVPEKSKIERPEDLPENAKIATKYVNITKKFFSELGKKVRIVRVSGSVEAMPILGAADAIVDVMSTGTTLRVHGLRPVYTILESEAKLIMTREDVNGEARYIIDKFVTLVRAVLDSQGRKLIMMNVPGHTLEQVLKVVPTMEGPSIAKVVSRRGVDMWEVITVVNEDELPDLVMRLKELGVKDILVLNIEKVIP